jgi:hypothetical protein
MCTRLRVRVMRTAIWMWREVRFGTKMGTAVMERMRGLQLEVRMGTMTEM